MKKIIPFSKEISFKTRIAEITDIEVTHNLEKTPVHTIEGSFLVNGTYKMTEASQIEEKFEESLPFIIEVDEKYDLEDVKIKISDFYFEIINEDTLKIVVEVELSDICLKEQQEEVRVEEVTQGLIEDVQDTAFEELEEAFSCEDIELKDNMRCYDEEEQEEKQEEESTMNSAIDTMTDLDIVDPIDIIDSEPLKPLDAVVDSSMTSTVSSKPVTDIFTSISQDEDTFKAYHVYIVRENDTLDTILSRYQVTKEEASEYNDLNDLKIGSKLILPCSKNE